MKIKDTLIYTRTDATTGLAAGEYTGMQAVKYDGINDGQLVFDKDGIARVGDVGSTQALATREETPNDGYIAYWDTASFMFKTKQISTSDLSDINNVALLNEENTFAENNYFSKNVGIGTTSPISNLHIF